MEDVVLGYDQLDGYLTNNPFFWLPRWPLWKPDRRRQVCARGERV
jgi:hypothetical protein